MKSSGKEAQLILMQGFMEIILTLFSSIPKDKHTHSILYSKNMMNLTCRVFLNLTKTDVNGTVVI